MGFLCLVLVGLIGKDIIPDFTRGNKYKVYVVCHLTLPKPLKITRVDLEW